MIDWFLQCFTSKPGGANNTSNSEQHASFGTSALHTQQSERAKLARNAVVELDANGEFHSAAMDSEVERTGQSEGPAVASLEEARRLIIELQTRIRELEGSAANDCLLQSTLATLTADKTAQAFNLAPGWRGSDTAPSAQGRVPKPDQDAEPLDGEGRAHGNSQHREPHPFRVYDKRELVDLLRSGGKPAAAVLLQAVGEEDLPNVSPALLLDVDPAFVEAMAGVSELLATVHSGRSMADLASLEHVPPYLRLRLYMVQAWAARPTLAYANSAARALFEARSDRQLQLVLEAHVQQDAMLAMLLQEVLDELLTAPVTRGAAATEAHSSPPGTGGVMTLHSVGHFVNTNNPKVFPFVPVTMRGCGYRKSSGDVVPCVVMEFVPDSNQGAFLEHLQRDYTMMSRLSSIITLFTLKGEVLHQNAESIAYFGYQRAAGTSGKRQQFRNSGGRSFKRLGGPLGPAGSAGFGSDERASVLTQLFQLAPPDTLEGMLESMVQGGVWRSILPVPACLTPVSRPCFPDGNLLHPYNTSFCTADPDGISTADTHALTGMDVSNFAPALGNTDRAMASSNQYPRAEVIEGSFALGKNRQSVTPVLNAVPEQSQETEHVSTGLQLPWALRASNGPGMTAAKQAVTSVRACVDASAEVLVDSPVASSSKPYARLLRPIRRSTTFSVAPVAAGTAVSEAGSNSFTAAAGLAAGGVGSGGHGPASTGGAAARLARTRRRSVFPAVGLDGGLSDALCQSTWGLLGSSAYDSSRISGRVPTSDFDLAAGGTAPRTASSRRASAFANLEAASTVAAVGGSLACFMQEGNANTASMPLASNADTSSQPLASLPQSQSHPFQLDPSQHVPWQIRNSYMVAAYQSHASMQSHLQGTSPPPGPAHWLVQESSPSGSLGLQSARTRSMASVAEQQRVLIQAQQLAAGSPQQGLVPPGNAAAEGAGPFLPGTAEPTPKSSIGSMVSLQPSAFQHPDYAFATGHVASAGGSAAFGRRSQHDGAAAGTALTSVFSSVRPPGLGPSLVAPGSASPLAHSAAAAVSSQPAHQQEAPGSCVAAAVGISCSGAAFGGQSNSGNATLAVRRGPMRQSDRLNPSLQPPRQLQPPRMSQVQSLQSSSSQTPALQLQQPQQQPSLQQQQPLRAPYLQPPVEACKSSTSFSFGSRTGNHRPLVRMMSFLHAAPHTHSQITFLGQPPETGQGAHSSSASAARFAIARPSLPQQLSSAAGRRQFGLARGSSALPQSPSETEGAPALEIVPKRGLPQELVLSPPLALDGEDGRLYHEITATPFLDPVSKSQVVMVVQTDVTARVRLERRLAEVMEAEHELLENIFPRHVLEHIATSVAVNTSSVSQFNLSMLSAMPDPTKTATDHDQVTILFADIVGFTSMCKEVPAKAVMKFLNDLYTRFDTLLDIYGVYKVETIGDCYMVAGGLISRDADGFAAVRKGTTDNLQAWRVLSFAKAMLRDAQKVLLPTTNEPVKMRVGIHTGPVVSGVVGARMPRFCLFGDTINTASRMESTCPYGKIQVSASTHALVPDESWEPTGGVQVKGKGMMETYLLRWSPSDAVVSGALGSTSFSVPGQSEAPISRKSVRAGAAAVAASSLLLNGGGGEGGAALRLAAGRDGHGLEKEPTAAAAAVAGDEAAKQRRVGNSSANPSYLFNTVC